MIMFSVLQDQIVKSDYSAVAFVYSSFITSPNHFSFFNMPICIVDITMISHNVATSFRCRYYRLFCKKKMTHQSIIKVRSIEVYYIN